MYVDFIVDQFSIYSGTTENNLRYRIESFHSPIQKIHLCTYPVNKTIGKLNARQLGIFYEARFEILHIQNISDQWFNGAIK